MQIKKLAVVLTVLASTGVGASLLVSGAAAQAPVYPIPCVDAGLSSASAAITAAAAVSPTLLTTKQFTFSFTADCTGGFRFVARMEDGRAGEDNKSVVVATELTTDTSGGVLTVDAALRPVGVAILEAADTDGKQTVLQLIAHERPAGSSLSAQAIQFLLI